MHMDQRICMYVLIGGFLEKGGSSLELFLPRNHLELQIEGGKKGPPRVEKKGFGRTWLAAAPRVFVGPP